MFAVTLLVVHYFSGLLWQFVLLNVCITPLFIFKNQTSDLNFIINNCLVMGGGKLVL